MLTTFDLVLILLVLIVFYAVRRYFNYLDGIKNLKQLEIQLNTTINPDMLNDLLDSFIEDVFNEYIINSSDLIQKTYITSDDETKMRSDLIDLVGDRLSPYVYQKLSVYYNEQAIPDIIAARVFQVVTAFVVTNNKPKQSKEDI